MNDIDSAMAHMARLSRSREQREEALRQAHHHILSSRQGAFFRTSVAVVCLTKTLIDAAAAREQEQQGLSLHISQMLLTNIL